MASLHGPTAISSNYQVRLPVALVRQLRIGKGDQFYWRLSDDDPYILSLLSVEVVERRYSAGERMERAAQAEAHELDPLDTTFTSDF